MDKDKLIKKFVYPYEYAKDLEKQLEAKDKKIKELEQRIEELEDGDMFPTDVQEDPRLIEYRKKVLGRGWK